MCPLVTDLLPSDDLDPSELITALKALTNPRDRLDNGLQAQFVDKLFGREWAVIAAIPSNAGSGRRARWLHEILPQSSAR